MLAHQHLQNFVHCNTKVYHMVISNPARKHAYILLTVFERTPLRILRAFSARRRVNRHQNDRHETGVTRITPEYALVCIPSPLREGFPVNWCYHFKGFGGCFKPH